MYLKKMGQKRRPSTFLGTALHEMNFLKLSIIFFLYFFGCAVGILNKTFTKFNIKKLPLVSLLLLLCLEFVLTERCG